MKHTPGPWKAGEGYLINSKDRLYYIGLVNIQKTLCETMANAHLIAAAPDLLDLAEKFLAYAKDHYNAMICIEIEKILNKAKGE